MNLLATLSLDQNKKLGEMSWYSTVVPLVAMQLNNPNIGPEMTCGAFLTLLLDLPAATRTQILQVSVHDQNATDEQVTEIKEASHKSLLLSLSGIFLVVCVVGLLLFIGYTELEGKPASKESVETIWGIIKEVATMLK